MLAPKKWNLIQYLVVILWASFSAAGQGKGAGEMHAAELRPDSVQATDSLTTAYYKEHKKVPGTAVLLSLLLTSSGHAYAGNWGRGLLFALGRLGGAALALTAGISSSTRTIGEFTIYEPEVITGWYWVGFGIIVAAGIWEAIDAGAEAGRYNEKLLKTLREEKSVGLNIVPGKDGARLQLRVSF